MDGVIHFFTNSWVVGIGTGAVSGLSVNIISRLIWARKDDKEFKQKVSSANNEILYSLRSAVAEASMPSEEIIESIARATAQKYEIKRDTLMSLTEVADALIKEVMDSNFLSQEQKDTYTTKIVAVTVKASKKRIQSASHVREDIYIGYRNNLSSRYINYFSLVTAAMVLVITTIISSDQSVNHADILDPKGELFPLLLTTLIIPVFAVLTLRDASFLNGVVNGIARSITEVMEGIAIMISQLFNGPRNKK